MNTANRRTFLQSTTAASLAASLAAASAPALLAGRATVAAETSTKIKIGQIGTKHAHASGKMATMRKMADLYEMVGVVEPDEKQRRAVENSASYRDLKWMTAEQLLNEKGLQAVAVETEVRDLVPTGLQCVSAGMHVHLDKPAGESLASFEKLLDESQRRKLVVQMGYMFRYNPAFRFLYQAVRDGWLGDLFELHGVMSKTVPAATRRKLAEYPGGSMFELGCHLIDSLVYVLGEPQEVTPYTRRTRDGDDLADNQLAVFECGKATATIRSAVVEVDGGRRRQFTVCGNQGTIDIRPLEPPVMQLALDRARGKYNRGYQTVELPRLGGRYDGDFLDLARIIREEKQHDFSPAHDLAVHKAILLASGLPAE